MKCVQLPSEYVSWITLQCQEGLIYDKNLRSCAIPGDDWECFNESEQIDDKNVYGVDNLDEKQDDEFLEVIDENLTSPEARYDTTFNEDNPSGDGEIIETVTPSTQTSRMITTQLQRLTQLMQHVSDQNNGVIDDEELSPDDLNSFLAVQNIQSNAADYRKTNLQSDEKTPMPSSGRIHPEILTDILDQQNQLNAEVNRLTTLSMDATTPKVPRKKPSRYINKDPITEIQLKSGQNSDGTGSHQIVVNRPEGSVLFNVPAPVDLKHHSPYLSEDILKSILEISKQMVTQNHQKQQLNQQSYAPQPFYYAVPIPVMQPQNNVQSFYSNDYRNNVTEAPIKKSKNKPQVEIVPTNYHPKVTEKVDIGLADNFGLYQPKNPQSYPLQSQNSQQTFQNPNYYYQNYPQYTSGYQNYQPYQPFNYQNQYPNQLGYGQQSNFDGAYYGNRPFVMESSAPSYVDHPIQQKPFRKESYTTSYDNEREEEDEFDGGLYDEVESDDAEDQPEKEELICSFVVQRQANKTDCYKYYVCNAKTKEVLSYSCPIFTAFNDQTKFCDSLTYKACKKSKDLERSSSQNQKIYDEAHAALAQVKKESQKVERIASMVREESQKIYNRRTNFPNIYQEQQAPVQYQNSFQQVQLIQKPLIRQQPVTLPPVVNLKPKPTRKSAKKKKRKVKCRDIGNIVDPESKSSYWHCFKGADGRMKRINRKCTQNFIFCPATRFCTNENRC